jgi:hypothetical protein
LFISVENKLIAVGNLTVDQVVVIHVSYDFMHLAVVPVHLETMLNHFLTLFRPVLKYRVPEQPDISPLFPDKGFRHFVLGPGFRLDIQLVVCV